MTTVRALPGEVTIYTVSEIKAQWLAWMSESPTPGDTATDLWPLDASAVEQIDAAGVQLLVSLSVSLNHQQQHLQLGHPSGPLTEACAALGLADWLATCASEGVPA